MIARVAGLLCIAAIVAGVYAGDMGGLDAHETLAVLPGVPASITASVHAFHAGIEVAAGIVGLGGVLGLAGIRNARRAGPLTGLRRGCAAVQASPSPIGREPEPAAR